MNGTNIAIVIPTFNEAQNLPELIRSLEEILPRDGLMLIILDYNSPDGTADVAQSLNSVYGNIFVQRRAGPTVQRSDRTLAHQQQVAKVAADVKRWIAPALFSPVQMTRAFCEQLVFRA